MNCTHTVHVFKLPLTAMYIRKHVASCNINIAPTNMHTILCYNFIVLKNQLLGTPGTHINASLPFTSEQCDVVVSAFARLNSGNGSILGTAWLNLPRKYGFMVEPAS